MQKFKRIKFLFFLMCVFFSFKFSNFKTVTYANLENKTYEKISEFHTDFKNGKQSRVNNITLATKAIDNKIVESGETFSFNETVGPTGKDNGYMKSKIFIDGKESEGYGGGVCQVSSTLYNACLDAKLTIIERHPHSLPVYYVPEDKDAATSHGGIDFKFKNDFNYSIRINTYILEEKIYVAIDKVV